MSSDRLKDKVAIVTGAGQGIGLGIARRLHKDGATIVIAEYDAAKGRNAAESLQRGTFIETDVTCREQVLAMVEMTLDQFDAVDILVNNAYPPGIPPSRLEDREDQEFERAFKGGFMPAWWAMKACFPSMKDRQWGKNRQPLLSQWRQCPSLYCGIQFSQGRAAGPVPHSRPRVGQVWHLRQYPMPCSHDPGL